MADDDNRSAIDALIEDAVEPSEEAPSEVDDLDEVSASEEAKASDDSGDVVTAESDQLEAALAERDSYLADSQRLAAEFSNFRKQSEKRVSDAAALQSAGLVKNLLPVLDACDSALVQDPDSSVGPIRSALLEELQRSGLELLAPANDEVFDPEMHEAVMHEAADDGADYDGPIVSEVLRAGYSWKGRVVRPAMVKVIG